MINAIARITKKYGIGGFLLSVIVVFATICAVSALLMVCWNYAVVAALPFVSKINFWTALVLKLCIGFLTPINWVDNKDDEEDN